MSSVIISGDVSGTVTLQAPSAAGSTVVTLPSTSMNMGNGGGNVSTNTAFGASALESNTTGVFNTAVGYQSLQTATADANTAVGRLALKGTTTGAHNTVMGSGAAYQNTTGTSLVGIGSSALEANTTGSSNVAIGRSALQSNTTASNNTAVGYQALYSNTVSNLNTAVGYQAGYTNVNSGNNVFIGQTAGYSHNTASLGNGFNVFVGISSGYSVTTGLSNTFIGSGVSGFGAGYYVTTGSKNTILGGYNGNQGGLDIRTLSNYIVLSDGDGNPRAYWPGNSQMFMPSNGAIRMESDGGRIYLASITSNSQFQISYNSTSAGVALGSGATSWSTFSDERLKNVTGTYTNALEDIAQIQPVKFTWKNDAENKPQVGVIAQSVQNVVPEAMDSTTYEMDGDTEYLQVRYTELIPLMIASIKELKAKVDAQAAEIAALKGQA